MNQEHLMRSLLGTLVVLIMSGCATSGKSVLTGTAVGAGVGSAIGALNPGQGGRNVFIGSTAGSLLGAGAGYLTHKYMEQRETRGKEKAFDENKFSQWLTSQGSSLDPDLPQLSDPIIEKQFIPDQVRGNQYMTGHWVFTIKNPTKWIKE